MCNCQLPCVQSVCSFIKNILLLVSYYYIFGFMGLDNLQLTITLYHVVHSYNWVVALKSC